MRSRRLTVVGWEPALILNSGVRLGDIPCDHNAIVEFLHVAAGRIRLGLEAQPEENQDGRLGVDQRARDILQLSESIRNCDAAPHAAAAAALCPARARATLRG